MEEWKEYKLGDILNFRRGHDLPKSEMRAGNIPVAGSNGIIGYHDTATPVSPCITIGRSGNVGTPYIYDKCWAHNTVLYVDDFKGNNPLYLFYLLKTLPLSSFGGGSAVPTLNRNHIHPLLVHHTSDLKLQERIANLLKSLDDKIECNRRINDNFTFPLLLLTCFVLWLLKLRNDNLVQQAQALFKSWFVDFEPYKGSGFEETEIGRIPKDLLVKRVSEIPHTIETGRRPKGGVGEITSGVPSVGAEHVKGLGNYDYSKTKYITEEYASSLKTGKVNGYELLIYKDGGKPGYFIPNYSIFGEGYPFEECFLNEHVFKLDFGNKGYNAFCYFYFWTDYVMNYLNAQGGKAAIPGINRQDIENIQIFAPENELVKRFGDIVLPSIRQILFNCKESRRLAQLRDTLLPRLMSGELKVNEVDCLS